MSKFFTSAALMLSMFAAYGVSDADAQVVVQFGETYQTSGDFLGMMTLPETGTLTVTATGELEGELYSPSNAQVRPTDKNVTTARYTNLPAGVYTYEASAFFMKSVTFTFEAGSTSVSLAVSDVYPAAGTAFSPEDYTDGVQVIFTPSPTSVTWSGVDLVYTRNGETLSIPVEGTRENGDPFVIYQGGALRAYINDIYMQMLNEGSVTGCEVVFKGVKADGTPVTESDAAGVTVNADGDITIPYKVLSNPQLVDYSMPELFYASWPSGNEAGIGTLKFDQNIRSVNVAEVMMGRNVWASEDGENESPFFEVPYTINANTLTLDFTKLKINQPDFDEVTVFVNGIVSEDGLMYRQDGIATFTEYIPYVNEALKGDDNTPEPPVEEPGLILALTPAADSSIPGFMEGDVLSVTFSDPQPQCVYLDLYNTTTGEFYQSWNLTSDNGAWTHEFGIDFVMYAENEYTGTFKLYSSTAPEESSLMATTEVVWYGNTEDPVSSSTFAGAQPENGSTVTLLDNGSFNFIVNFTNPVKALDPQVNLGMGVTQPAEAYPANSPEGTYSWAVTVPAELVQECLSAYDCINVSIVATGEDGKLVYYDGLPYIGLEYYVEGAAHEGVEISVSLDGATVDVPVKDFTVASNAGKIVANDFIMVLEDGTTINPFESIAVYGADDQVFATAESFDETTGTVTLSAPINLTGEYTLILPYRAFTIGEEYESQYSAETIVNFTATAPISEVQAHVVTPIPGMSQISAMQVIWGDNDGVILTQNVETMKVYLTTPKSKEERELNARLAVYIPDDGESGVFETHAIGDRNNSILVNFYDTNDYGDLMAFTALGTYSLRIPEATVLVGSIPNQEVTVSYTIGAPTMSIATLDNPTTDVVNSFSTVSMTWDLQEVVLNNDKKGDVYIVLDGVDRISVESVDLVSYDPSAEGGIGQLMTLADNVYRNNMLQIGMPIFDLWGHVGTVDLYIPAGLVTNLEGLVNPAQQFHFVQLPLTTEKPSLDPTPGSYLGKELETIVVTWEGMTIGTNSTDKVRIDAPIEGQLLVDEVPGLLEYIYADMDEGSNDESVITAIQFNIGEVLKNDGQYQLVLAQDSFILTDANGEMYLNEDGYFEYIVSEASGIEKFVDAQDGRYVVYGINGMQVLSTENAADLQGLDAGLYIINGKKVLVRK